VKELARNNFKLNDKASNDIIMKHFGGQWKDKCERSLLLAKNLGNIYTGSLYCGMLSLICDESIDLTHKQIMMFSYGSGCAASMFTIRCEPEYKHV
jgi:hydroxymethylglutaryl-CoA synthase